MNTDVASMPYQVSGGKVKNFTDLTTWVSHALVLAVYKITGSFPKENFFDLVSQLRRAAVSITSNIAEGFSRSTAADKTHFYVTASGSLTELQNQLLIARGVGYLEQSRFKSVAEQTVSAQKLLNGLIKAIKAGKGTKHDT